jgi:hypothetical protein
MKASRSNDGASILVLLLSETHVVQTIADNHNVASTEQAAWFPVAFFLKDENGEVLGGLLGDI